MARSLRKDAVTGFSVALSQIPDGMAGGLLAGVNPIYGLYTTIFPPIVGSLLSSTQLLIIASTSAAALTAAQAVAGYPEEQRAPALFLLTILSGLAMLGFGLLRLGKVVRFVSYSVMQGFLYGIAALTVLSQIPTIVGFDPGREDKVSNALAVLLAPSRIGWTTLGIALLAMALIVGIGRTRWGQFATISAVAIPSVLVFAFGWGGVEQVRDVGAIPSGLPMPQMPDVSLLTPGLLASALALAVVVLIQGAGVGQSVPNPDGSRVDLSRDFMAQGAANVAGGLFRAIPGGGSLGATSLNRVSGATSRWAGVFMGLWSLMIMLLAPGLIERVAMPALAAILIYASATAISLYNVGSIGRTGWTPRLSMIVTFLATLFLPIYLAVALGILLSMALTIYDSATDLSLRRMILHEGRRVTEAPVPANLPAGEVVVIEPYGSLSFAGARTLEAQLPKPGEGAAAVVLRLRGRHELGATLIEVIDGYARRVEDAGSLLFLSELGENAVNQLRRTRKIGVRDEVGIFPATENVGDATRQAVAEAVARLGKAGTGDDR